MEELIGRVIGGTSPLPGTGTTATGFWGPLHQVLHLLIDQAFAGQENPDWGDYKGTLSLLVTQRDNVISSSTPPKNFKSGDSPSYDEGEIFVLGFHNPKAVRLLKASEFIEALIPRTQEWQKRKKTLLVDLEAEYGYNSLELPGETWVTFHPFIDRWYNWRKGRMSESERKAFSLEIRKRVEELKQHVSKVIVKGEII